MAPECLWNPTLGTNNVKDLAKVDGAERLQVVQGITEGRGGQFRADRPHESPAVQHGKTDGHERTVEAPGESRGRAIHAKEQRRAHRRS